LNVIAKSLADVGLEVELAPAADDAQFDATTARQPRRR